MGEPMLLPRFVNPMHEPKFVARGRRATVTSNANQAFVSMAYAVTRLAPRDVNPAICPRLLVNAASCLQGGHRKAWAFVQSANGILAGWMGPVTEKEAVESI
jgi:hypothetical protein